jgi:hypothetical protein
MPTTGSNLGIIHSWAERESGWKAGMDANLLKLDTLVQLSVKDKDLATPPGSPATGDRYIVAGSPTGAWAGHATHVTVWSGAAWIFYAPKAGWFSYVEDEALFYKFTTSWVTSGI